ncbi:hypothetical protein HDU98_006663 [Podochytrium sp. JEL0797]|nr:hypothetical protein HDU98_006663 [Podochytrium sp. JEL0797]
MSHPPHEIALVAAASLLLTENGLSTSDVGTTAPSKLRAIVSSLLAVRSPGTAETNTENAAALYSCMETVLRHEASLRPATDASVLTPIGSSQIALWKGDVSLLKTDVVVNAANSSLLGCFDPDHFCIDASIHARAGPRLRDACAAAAKLLPSEEGLAVAQVVSTEAFCLPAKKVFHTVGPHLGENTIPTDLQKSQLVSCYLNCLDLAVTLHNPTLSIAFPCISTGDFGFPSEIAAPLVTKAVQTWLATHQEVAQHWKIIFAILLDKDFAYYSSALQELFPEDHVPLLRSVECPPEILD